MAPRIRSEYLGTVVHGPRLALGRIGGWQSCVRDPSRFGRGGFGQTLLEGCGERVGDAGSRASAQWVREERFPSALAAMRQSCRKVALGRQGLAAKGRRLVVAGITASAVALDGGALRARNQ